MPLKKAHCIDKLPWWGAALIAVGYLLSFLICVGVGSAGPGPANLIVPENGPGSQTNCTDAAACSVTYVHTFSGLTGYDQALWLVAVFDRPNDTVTGLPVLQNAAFDLPVDFTVSAVGFDSNGNKAQIAANATNTAVMQCVPGRRTCAYSRLFFQAFLYYETYVVTTTFVNPYSGFITAGEPAQHIDLRAPVGLRLLAGTVNPAFTHFQIASKYTFFALSLIMLFVYLGFLTFGRGGRDPRNPKLSIPSTNEQMWVTLLGAWLVWANDPFAAVGLTTPSFAASGFYTFCAVTFGVLLLLYFLVIFDLARDPARSGSLPVALQPLGASAQLARRCNCGAVAAAALFWAPKVIWCTITWALLLSYYVIQRAAWLSDPTFDLFGYFPLLQKYFYTFAAAWGAFYVIYLAVFIIMALANCRRIAPSSRYIIAITLVTLIAFLVGYFMNGMVAVNAANSAVLFMTVQGAINVYVYFLMIAYLPARAHSVTDAMAAVQADQAAFAAGRGLTQYGGVLEAATAPKLLSEGFTQTEESALLGGEGHGDSGSVPLRAGVGAGAGAGSPTPSGSAYSDRPSAAEAGDVGVEVVDSGSSSSGGGYEAVSSRSSSMPVAPFTGTASAAARSHAVEAVAAPHALDDDDEAGAGEADAEGHGEGGAATVNWK